MDEIKALLKPWIKLPGHVASWTIDPFTRYELTCYRNKLFLRLKSTLTEDGPNDVLVGELDADKNLIALNIGQYTRDIDEAWLLNVVQEIIARDNKY